MEGREGDAKKAEDLAARTGKVIGQAALKFARNTGLDRRVEAAVKREVKKTVKEEISRRAASFTVGESKAEKKPASGAKDF